MSKVTLSLTLLTKHVTSYTLVMLLAFVVGCAEVGPEDTGNNPWVPASTEIKQSLGVSTWYVETLDEGTTRIVGYDQSDIQLSEMKISTPVLNQVKTLTYELHVTHHTWLIMTESAVIENTLSVEPRGQEWFDAMVNVPSLVKNSSTVNKSLATCVGQEAGMEIASILCDVAGGGHGSPNDYAAVCSAIWRCLASDYNSNTHLASNNTGNTEYDGWSSNNNTDSGCYDDWGYSTPCQNNYQDNYQDNYQNNQDSTCYDSWGYPVSCDIW